MMLMDIKEELKDELKFWSTTITQHANQNFSGKYNDFIRKTFPFKKGEHRLEIGSGPCNAFRWKDMTLIGIDPLMEEYIKIGYPTDWFSMMKFDGVHIPFSNYHFETVYFLNVLDHMKTEDMQPLIDEIYRVMSDYGTLYFYCDLRDNDANDGKHKRMTFEIICKLFSKFDLSKIRIIACPHPSCTKSMCGEMKKIVH